MKKQIVLLLCVVLSVSITGCGGGGTAGRSGSQAPGVNDVLEAGMEAADKETDAADKETNAADKETDAVKTVDSESLAVQTSDERQVGVNQDAPAPETDEGTDVPLSTTAGIDIDLTTLSSTMVYSEVFNMMSTPENYKGKNVKMGGIFAYYLDESTGTYYFACIVQDATACCSQGIEFVLAGEHTYPDDYPEPGDEIVVTGVFDTYDEGEYTYCTLRDAQFV